MTCWADVDGVGVGGGGVCVGVRPQAVGLARDHCSGMAAPISLLLLSSYIFLPQISGLGSVWVMPACRVSSVSPPPLALLRLSSTTQRCMHTLNACKC